MSPSSSLSSLSSTIKFSVRLCDWFAVQSLRYDPVVCIAGFQWGFAMAGAYVYLTLLYPIIWRIWIYYASGNANFYYALNLVTAFANSTILSEALSAVLKRRFLIKKKRQEAANGDKKDTTKSAKKKAD